MKQQFANWIKQIQTTICDAAEKTDGIQKFVTDEWSREGGGGGITRIISEGTVFEKGAVNTSEVYGEITPTMQTQLHVTGSQFYATGISLILHPLNPMVPTVHANYRYFEVYDETGAVKDFWFGGGADLTPYYLFDEDAELFHETHKTSCDKFDKSFYSKFKKQCDDYFVNTHRNNERRGIGGIFYDRLKPNEKLTSQQLFEFAKSNAQAFIDSYFPIAEKRKNLPFTHAQKHWQLIRRGRYVEFNLIHDRGTIFGLKSNGRTESILASLPPEVRFEYNYTPMPDSEEAKLQKILLSPREWI